MGRILFCLIVSPLRLLVLVVLLINAAAHASVDRNAPQGPSGRAEGLVVSAPSPAAPKQVRELSLNLPDE